MTIKVENLDQEEAWAVGGVLPAGWHICKITDIEERVSSGGHPQIQVDLEAIVGEHAGGTITDWIVVIPSTYGKVKQLLEAAGVDIVPGEWEFDPSVLEGCEVSILVRQEPKYDDPSKLINKVAGYEMARAAGVDRASTNGTSDDDIPF